jgi:hypothetical protein
MLTTLNYADDAAVQTAIRANMTAQTATTAAEGFLMAYDNGVDTFLANVDINAVEADGELLAAAVVTTVTTLKGITDNSTLTAANFLDFVA